MFAHVGEIGNFGSKILLLDNSRSLKDGSLVISLQYRYLLEAQDIWFLIEISGISA